MLQGTKKDGLPPRSPVVHVDVTCKFRSMRQPKTFIAFGPHTHNHGTNVQGFLYRNKQITEIAQHDPQERQMFYPMKKETAIYNSDYIGLKCTFNTMEENRTINFGMLQYRNNLFLFFMHQNVYIFRIITINCYCTYLLGHTINDEMCVLYFMYYSKEDDASNFECFDKEQKDIKTKRPSKFDKQLLEKNLPKKGTTRTPFLTNLLSIFKYIISVI